jgi:subtilisin family serine protease
MYSGQKWVFDMIRVVPVWEMGYFGTGVRVRINDGGVVADHPEFAGRIDRDGSCDVFEPPPERFESDPNGVFHGTAVASIVGAAGDNDECAVGIAPNVTLSSCYVFGGGNILATKLDQMDISQNSYGIDGCSKPRRRVLQGGDCPFQFSDTDFDFPCDVCDFNDITPGCEDKIITHCTRHYEDDVDGCIEFLDLILGGQCNYGVLKDDVRETITRGILEGRDGKGIIYVWASGNAFTSGDDTNFQGFSRSRFVISVGAVGKDERHSSFSTPGASLFLTAPGGDFENISNHITANIGGECRDAGSGTSFSCPVVSGVIALILEANPKLTWRDVQGVLALTSRQITDAQDDTVTVNAAGFWHSNLYGFGIVDAEAAVQAAESWELYTAEKMVVGESEILNEPISDNPNTPVGSSITVTPLVDNFIAEGVAVYVDMEHFSRGDLEIMLTSPQGTVSMLHPGQRPENTQLDEDERWKFLTVRSWGESAIGDWSLSIVDLKAGDVAECASAAWAYEPDSATSITCHKLELLQYCSESVLDPLDKLDTGSFNLLFGHVDNDRTAAEACCACGGGINTNDVVDQLRQWRIVVYGREFGSLTRQDDSSSSPTNAPTAQPTRETVSVTGSPTESSIANNTSAPSPIQNLNSTQIPSGSPTSVANTDNSTQVPTGSNASNTTTPSNTTNTSIGCQIFGDLNVCPANADFESAGQNLTLLAQISCPNDSVQQSSFVDATQKGLCTCDASLMDHGMVETDAVPILCDCFACPDGSRFGFAYDCNRTIVGPCTSFNCAGLCNGEMNLGLDQATFAPTGAPTEATEAPSQFPSRAPIVALTPSPSSSTEATEASSQFPSRAPIVALTSSPSSSTESSAAHCVFRLDGALSIICLGLLGLLFV